MAEATIPVSETKSLLALFGTRDQHLRRIREALGVTISSRNDRIHIAGDDLPVARATELFEQLQAVLKRQGSLAPEEVADALARVTGGGVVEHAALEDLQHAGRPIRPRTGGQARY